MEDCTLRDLQGWKDVLDVFYDADSRPQDPLPDDDAGLSEWFG